MNKKEFLEYMKQVENRVKRRKPVCVALYGLCSFAGNLRAREAFNEYFYSPLSEHFAHHYWLDDFPANYDGMTALERRLVFLESFKNWCLVYKEYKNF